MLYFQIVILGMIVTAFLVNLYRDFNGREAKDADGFAGAIVTIIVFVAMLLLYWAAGAFSLLLG